LYLLRGGKRTPVAVPPGGVTAIRFPRRASEVLTFSIDSPTSPLDVWQVSVKSGKLQRWTRSEVGGIDSERFVAPELVRYPSTDGLQIPAFLYRPAGAPAGARFPVVVSWHGGPEAQARPQF